MLFCFSSGHPLRLACNRYVIMCACRCVVRAAICSKRWMFMVQCGIVSTQLRQDTVVNDLEWAIRFSVHCVWLTLASLGHANLLTVVLLRAVLESARWHPHHQPSTSPPRGVGESISVHVGSNISVSISINCGIANNSSPTLWFQF